LCADIDFVSLCLQRWVIAHFRHVVTRSRYQDYERENPYVGRWKPRRGFKHADHFRDLLDSMEHCHVTWRPYEHRGDVTPFQDVCWYSGWIMAGKQKMVRHLPERVVRKYGYVQKVPRPPTTIIPLVPADVVAAFLSLLCMSFPSSGGVTRSLTTSLGSIQIGTLGGSTVYPILLLSTLL